MIEDLQARPYPILLLDCGGLFPEKCQEDAQVRSEIALEALDLMGYQVLNLGIRELQWGLDFLQKQSGKLSMQMISTNLSVDRNKYSFISPYYKTVIGDINVLVLGVMPDNFQAAPEPVHLPPMDEVRVLAPDKAIKGILESTKDRIDLVILLSGLGKQETQMLKKRNPGIDIAFSRNETLSSQSSPDVESGVISCGEEREHINQVWLEFGEDKTITKKEVSRIFLPDIIAQNEKMWYLITSEYERKAEKKRQETLSRLRREGERNLELTPEEFFEQEMKKQQLDLRNEGK